MIINEKKLDKTLLSYRNITIHWLESMEIT